MPNTIHEKLSLAKATNTELSFYPGEKGLNGVLTVKAPLTVEASKVLDCEQRFYNLNETAYADYTGRLSLKRVIKQCKVMIGESLPVALLPDMIWKFSIGLEKDSKPSVEFRMHFDSQWRQTLVDMVNALNTDEYQIEILALQQSLFAPNEAIPDTGDGVRVDLSTRKPPADDRQRTIDEALNADKDTGCVSCNTGIPMQDETTHDNGMKCTARSESTASAAEPAGENRKERRGRHAATGPVASKRAAHRA